MLLIVEDEIKLSFYAGDKGGAFRLLPVERESVLYVLLLENDIYFPLKLISAVHATDPKWPVDSSASG